MHFQIICSSSIMFFVFFVFFPECCWKCRKIKMFYRFIALFSCCFLSKYKVKQIKRIFPLEIGIDFLCSFRGFLGSLVCCFFFLQKDEFCWKFITFLLCSVHYHGRFDLSMLLGDCGFFSLHYTFRFGFLLKVKKENMFMVIAQCEHFYLIGLLVFLWSFQLQELLFDGQCRRLVFKTKNKKEKTFLTKKSKSHIS